MVIDAFGKVGINTTAPAELLHVNGTIKSTTLNVTGACSAGTYSGLPTATTSDFGLVKIAAGDHITVFDGIISIDDTDDAAENSDALVTSGGVYSAISSIKPMRLLVAEFTSNATINFNSPNRWFTWDTTINSNGIIHNSSTTVPNGSLFTVNEDGLYHISVLIKVQAAGGRHGLVLDLHTATGSNPSARPTNFDAIYGIANGYCRGSQTQTNRLDLVGSITLVLEAGQQFEIIGRCTYNTSSSTVNSLSGSTVRVERIK